MGAQVAQELLNLFRLFAKAHHRARFRQRRRAIALGELEHVEGLLVICLGTNFLVQGRDRFHIVVEDVRLCVEHAGHGVHVATEIRREHFHARIGQRKANFANGLGEVP